MTWLLWGLSLALLALVARRQRIAERAELDVLRRPYPADLFSQASPQVSPQVAAPPAWPAARPALQTGVAILALALALDVSAASHWSPPASVEAIHGEAELPSLDLDLDLDLGLDLTTYAPPWTAASLATDGWFV
jgi:hypothetical protein